MDENDLAGLSPEEREALAGDDEERGTLEAVLEEAGGNDDAGAGDEGDQSGGATDTTANADADKADDAGKADGPSAGDATDQAEDDAPFRAAFVPPSTEGIDEKLAALDATRGEVMQKFREGDITVDEMEDQLRALGSERETLLTEKTKASVVAELATQTAQQQWQYDVNRFLKTTLKAEGIDYRADTEQGKKLNAALDFTVKLLANDPENASRDNDWFLEEAHRITKARFNLGSTPTPGAQPAVADPRAKAVADRRPNLKSVPTTLAHVPASGSDDGANGDSEFAHLDRLEGMDLEAAVARMSPRDQERWARTG